MKKLILGFGLFLLTFSSFADQPDPALIIVNNSKFQIQTYGALHLANICNAHTVCNVTWGSVGRACGRYGCTLAVDFDLAKITFTVGEGYVWSITSVNAICRPAACGSWDGVKTLTIQDR